MLRVQPKITLDGGFCWYPLLPRGAITWRIRKLIKYIVLCLINDCNFKCYKGNILLLLLLRGHTKVCRKVLPLIMNNQSWNFDLVVLLNLNFYDEVYTIFEPLNRLEARDFSQFSSKYLLKLFNIIPSYSILNYSAIFQSIVLLFASTTK